VPSNVLKLFNYAGCAPTQPAYVIFFKEKFWCIKKKGLSLHRYPENNLFTLKRLIPIEDIERQPVKVIALFFYVYFDTIDDFHNTYKNNTARNYTCDNSWPLFFIISSLI